MADERADKGPGASLDWPGKRAAFATADALPHGELVDEERRASAHRLIEGDNLDVLRALQRDASQRARLIYIDPPYNTGRSFLYSDRFGAPGADARSAWLDMMAPRLVLGRRLLREDGALFVSIDDREVHYLRLLLDEIFGAANFVTGIVWHKVFASKASARHFSESHEHVLVYARDKELWQRNLLPRNDEQLAAYTNPDDDPRGPWRSVSLSGAQFVLGRLVGHDLSERARHRRAARGDAIGRSPKPVSKRSLPTVASTGARTAAGFRGARRSCPRCKPGSCRRRFGVTARWAAPKTPSASSWRAFQSTRRATYLALPSRCV